MKLVRYGAIGHELPGMIDQSGILRNISKAVPDISGLHLGPESLARLCDIDPTSFPLVEGSPRIGPCVGKVGKFIGIGLNYKDHAEEAGMKVPDEIPFFMKATSSICGPFDPIEMPRGAAKVDWEVELGVVIGSRAKYATAKEALGLIAGYCLVNDISERSFQLERGTQWSKGKGSDSFGPIGPWLVTVDELTDAENLTLCTVVNGKRYQCGSTSNMVHNVSGIISYVSQFMTLLPG